jgi:hypothetical protein
MLCSIPYQARMLILYHKKTRSTETTDPSSLREEWLPVIWPTLTGACDYEIRWDRKEEYVLSIPDVNDHKGAIVHVDALDDDPSAPLDIVRAVKEHMIGYELRVDEVLRVVDLSFDGGSVGVRFYRRVITFDDFFDEKTFDMIGPIFSDLGDPTVPFTDVVLPRSVKIALPEYYDDEGRIVRFEKGDMFLRSIYYFYANRLTKEDHDDIVERARETDDEEYVDDYSVGITRSKLVNNMRFVTGFYWHEGVVRCALAVEW